MVKYQKGFCSVLNYPFDLHDFPPELSALCQVYNHRIYVLLMETAKECTLKKRNRLTRAHSTKELLNSKIRSLFLKIK